MLDAIAHSTAQVIDLMIPHDPGMRALLLVIALNADAILGEPDWLWRRLPHPVVFFGKAIAAMTADHHPIFCLAIVIRHDMSFRQS